MKVTITDVTSLGGGRVCIAGISADRFIRLGGPNPMESWVKAIGGVTPGNILDVAWKPKAEAVPPHVEDGFWDTDKCKVVGSIDYQEFFQLLQETSVGTIREAFGDPLFVGKNGNGAFPSGKGLRSLATIRGKAVSVSKYYERVRIEFEDEAEIWSEVPFQDLIVKRHLVDCNQCTLSAQRLIDDFQGRDALLRVGLAREWSPGNYDPACWLQINHVFFNPSRRAHFI